MPRTCFAQEMSRKDEDACAIGRTFLGELPGAFQKHGTASNAVCSGQSGPGSPGIRSAHPRKSPSNQFLFSCCFSLFSPQQAGQSSTAENYLPRTEYRFSNPSNCLPQGAAAPAIMPESRKQEAVQATIFAIHRTNLRIKASQSKEAYPTAPLTRKSAPSTRARPASYPAPVPVPSRSRQRGCCEPGRGCLRNTSHARGSGRAH